MPAPVGPVSRNSPASLSSSKSTRLGAGERTERGDGQPVQPHQPTSSVRPSREVGVAVVVDAAGVAGELEQQLLLGGGLEVADLRDEAERDVEVAAAVDAGHDRAARRGRRPRARSRASACAGTGRASRSIACSGRRGSVSVTCSQASSASACRGSASRSSSRPRSVRSRRGTGAVDELGALGRRRRRGRPARSPWSGRPRRTSRPAGSRCSGRLGQGLPAVQVAERGVVDAGEQAGRRDLDAADGDVPLAVGGHPRAPPRRCRRRRRAPAPPSGSRAGVARSAWTRAIAAVSAASWLRVGQLPGGADRVGLEVGDAVDGDRAVRVLEQHRGADVLPAGPQVHARRRRRAGS